jgi:acetylornithine deacetylase/succinyl-diaminopimelate desuccinylase-like protein
MSDSALAAPNLKSLAGSAELREPLLWFARERNWINEHHVKVCRIPAPTFLEQKRAEWVARQLQELGWEARLDRAGNVVARRPGPASRPEIALTAHLDTVLAPRHPEDVIAAPDGTLRGPGVSDNGAGLAGLLALGAVIARHDLFADTPCGVVLIANVGEEGEGNLSGMRYLCRPGAERFRAFLVLDGPATSHVTCQALASRRFECSLTGQGGHSWSDHGTANPVHALSRAVTLFCDARLAANGSGPRASFNFGVIDGGASVTSIPVHARVKVDLRSESPDLLDELTSLLTSSLERALEAEHSRSTGARLTARLKELGSRPGGRLPENSPLLRHLRAVDLHLGIRAQLDCSSTDANIPLSLGIPAVSIGSGGRGGGAHSPDEWYHPDGREIGLRRVLLTLALLARDPEIAAP